MREITSIDWMDVVRENGGRFHRSVDGKIWASYFLNRGEYSTGLYDTHFEAARQYCIDNDLVGQVMLRRLNVSSSSPGSSSRQRA
jgi:hypothetical protein